MARLPLADTLAFMRPRTVTPASRRVSASLAVLSLLSFAVPATPLGAQVLLDRVLARVNGIAITLSDVRAAQGLGLTGDGDASEAIEVLVQRQLILAEVQRFQPPEPPAAAIDAEAATLRARSGADLARLLASTGLDDSRVRAIARENLRIQSYLDLRFGTNLQVTDEEVEEYYRTHPEEFTRNGELQPFNQVQSDVRLRASTLRRQGTIDQWLRDLRTRADVSMPSR